MNKQMNIIKYFYTYYQAQKTTVKVRAFVRKHRDKDVIFEKNIWNRNYYWDYYYQRHEESLKSRYYVPYDYFNYKVLPKLNNSDFAVYIDDKNMYDKIFGKMGVRLPKTIFRCYHNLLMDGEYRPIFDFDSFTKEIKQEVIIKPSIDTYGGSGIEKYVMCNGRLVHIHTHELLDIEKLVIQFNGNFIAQEVIKQHAELAKFHPGSVNTLRVDSYRSVKTNKVHCLMAFFRMGTGQGFVDNITFGGGISVGVLIDESHEAILRTFKYKEFSNERITAHPDTHIAFKGFKIPNFPAVVKSIEILSNVVPHHRVLAWDFTINQDGHPVFIEVNRAGGVWGSQALNNEPFFGDFSEEVYEYLKE